MSILCFFSTEFEELNWKEGVIFKTPDKTNGVFKWECVLNPGIEMNSDIKMYLSCVIA